MAAAPSISSSEIARLEAERQRLAEALALAERDRQLLGYEIHDGIIQDLSAAVMLLEGASRQATFASAEGQENHAAGLRLLRASIAGARQLIGGLRQIESSGVDLPLALRRLVEKFRADHSLAVTFECEADDLRLPTAVQQMLLRIAQEALFNSCKHAQAEQTILKLVKDRDELILSITDDGVGFDPNRVPAGHFGLEGIRARAQVLTARLKIDSSPGNGTSIEVQLALPTGARHA